MDADKIVAFVVWGRLVGEYIAPHEMSHHEILRAKRNHGEARETDRSALFRRCLHFFAQRKGQRREPAADDVRISL